MTKSAETKRYSKEPEPLPDGSVLWDPCPGLAYKGIQRGHTGQISIYRNGKIEQTNTFMSLKQALQTYPTQEIFNTESDVTCPDCTELWNSKR